MLTRPATATVASRATATLKAIPPTECADFTYGSALEQYAVGALAAPAKISEHVY
jgi:hypothetical protein